LLRKIQDYKFVNDSNLSLGNDIILRYAVRGSLKGSVSTLVRNIAKNDLVALHRPIMSVMHLLYGLVFIEKCKGYVKAFCSDELIDLLLRPNGK
jgi:hypothetical protein